MEISKIKYSSYSDQELLSFLRVDDRDAFNEIYSRYWQTSFHLANNILKDGPAAEDAVQEVFAEIWLKRKYSLILNPRSYLFQAIRFQSFKIIRHNKVIAEYVERDFILNFSVNDGEGNLFTNDINAIVNQIVSNLPVKCREIFILSRNGHMSAREIATQLSISPKTVDNQLNIALKRIRVALASSLVLIEIILSQHSA
ncbi:RNA polymerase sigma-70 factor [Pedobacter sp. P26]|uniref:RNA polymerase sigma-70 factor n=1 Tax=Pedobacter sp. P26 TaxID=3423956 RepID=UPI003D663DB8